MNGKKNKNIRKWIINASTIAALTTAGYKVGEFNQEKGYPVVDTLHVRDTIVEQVTRTVQDTIWFKDSLKLEKFASFGKVKFGGSRFVNKKEDIETLGKSE